MLLTAGNTPREVLAVLFTHAARAAAQRACALRWLAVLWKQRDTRAEEFVGQFDRVRRLHSAAAAR